MKKIVLCFPSKDSMAEFLLACKIKGADVDTANNIVSGMLDDECIEIAFSQYQAFIPEPPDFLITK